MQSRPAKPPTCGGASAEKFTLDHRVFIRVFIAVVLMQIRLHDDAIALLTLSLLLVSFTSLLRHLIQFLLLLLLSQSSVALCLQRIQPLVLLFLKLTSQFQAVKKVQIVRLKPYAIMVTMVLLRALLQGESTQVTLNGCQGALCGFSSVITAYRG